MPGVIRPAASAVSIMERPMRSFTEEHGFMDSNFTATRARLPSVTLFRYTSGVRPARKGGVIDVHSLDEYGGMS